jgi:transposase
MDGASYHKHRINPVPHSGDKKDKILDWFYRNNVMLPIDNERGKLPTVKTLLQAVKDMHIQPQFACYKISTKYRYRVLFTPPYHPEVQPIEKVWAIVKNPIAYDPNPEETTLR